MVALDRSPQVWFITGTSSGFGLHLVETALARGDRVIATARSLAAIRHLEQPNCRVLELDVTSSPAVLQRAAKEAVGFWGRVDVLVNNAGFCGLGIAEEAGAAGFMKQFAPNFFGVINVTNAFLPYMRAAANGTVVIIGSRHAWKTLHPMTGAYAASKAAVHAYGEALSTELAPFGVRVLLVQPGAHRTRGIPNALAPKNDIARGHTAAATTTTTTTAAADPDPTPPTRIAAYDAQRTLGHARLRAQAGRQPGDAAKAAQAIADVVGGTGPAAGRACPLWLVLGADAEDDLRRSVALRLQNLDAWRDVTRATAVDCDDGVVLI